MSKFLLVDHLIPGSLHLHGRSNKQYWKMERGIVDDILHSSISTFSGLFFKCLFGQPFAVNYHVPLLVEILHVLVPVLFSNILCRGKLHCVVSRITIIVQLFMRGEIHVQCQHSVWYKKCIFKSEKYLWKALSEFFHFDSRPITICSVVHIRSPMGNCFACNKFC